MEHGLRDLINEADSLGNTPLHHLIVRYALEERRYGYQDDHQPWNKWDMLHIVRFLLQNGARPSINQARNSALACVLRFVFLLIRKHKKNFWPAKISIPCSN